MQSASKSSHSDLKAHVESDHFTSPSPSSPWLTPHQLSPGFYTRPCAGYLLPPLLPVSSVLTTATGMVLLKCQPRPGLSSAHTSLEWPPSQEAAPVLTRAARVRPPHGAYCPPSTESAFLPTPAMFLPLLFPYIHKYFLQVLGAPPHFLLFTLHLLRQAGLPDTPHPHSGLCFSLQFSAFTARHHVTQPRLCSLAISPRGSS